MLHIGCNETPDKTSNVILNDILKVRTGIETVLPTTERYLSCLVLRLDQTKAGFALYQLIRKMKTLEDVIVNDIDVSCLGKAGLHLNPRASDRLQ